MQKYYVIAAQDDNSIYQVHGFDKKEEAKRYGFYVADSCFVTIVVSGDCMKYSDNEMVKKARKKLKEN